MTALALRATVLALVVLGAFVAVRLWEQRRGRVTTGLAPGVTLVTGPDCRLCEPALEAIRAGGVEPTIVDVEHGRRVLGSIASLPVAVVAASDGSLVMRRAGRSVITDATDLVSAARAAARVT